MSLRSTAILAGLLAAGACRTEPLDWQGSPGGQRLRHYKDSYYRALGDRFVGALGWRDFVAELRGAEVLYLGDHHQDPLLHERILDLLSRLALEGLQPVLGLEAIGEQDETLVQDYLQGRIGLAVLRLRMLERWPGSWLDSPDVDAAFYRRLLELARESYWPVFGLEPTPRLPLERRDAEMAASIRRAHHRHQGRLLVVVVGQAHLLGRGGLVHRAGLRPVAIGANLSPQLVRRLPAVAAGSDARFLRSSSGVLFFNNWRSE